MTLTQKDLDEIEQIIDQKLDEKLDDRIRNLPTKDEFFNAMDEIMGELKTIREEHTILTNQVSEHGNRIEQLETIHPKGQHTRL